MLWLRTILSTLALGLIACVAWAAWKWFLPAHLLHDEASGLSYLDSSGIALALFFAAGLMLTLVQVIKHLFIGMELMEKGDAAGVNHLKFAHCLHGDEMVYDTLEFRPRNGADREAVREIFKSGICLRAAKFALLCCRCALNVTFIHYNFQTLPPRDPVERLNMSKYIVAWIEYAGVFAIGAGVALYVVNSLSVYAYKKWNDTFETEGGGMGILQLTALIEMLSEVSCMRSLSYFNSTVISTKMMRTFDHFQKRSNTVVAGLLTSLSCSFFGLLAWCGSLAMLVKVSQIGFAAVEPVGDWEEMEYVRFLAFMNNICSIIDVADIKKQTILEFIVQNSELTHTSFKSPRDWAWKDNLLKEMLLEFGWVKTVVTYATLDAADYKKLLTMQLDDNVLPPSFNDVISRELPDRYKGFKQLDNLQRGQGLPSSPMIETEGAE